MQMSDSQRIAAPQSQVWDALNDPDILKQCIPGCQSLEMTTPNNMTATVVIKVGPIKATFNGKVTLSDLDPPNSYRIQGEGSGGIAGFASGGASVQLQAESADVTVLRYDVDAQIGGKLAQLGGRLVDVTSKKLAAEFFTAFAMRVASPPDASPVNEPVKKPWLNRLIGSAGAGCLLFLAAANWCCITGHVHAAGDPLAGAPICSSASHTL